MGKTTKGAPAPTIKLEDLDAQYGRLVLRHPSTYEELPDYWMDVAGIHSQEFEDAKVKLLLKSRNAPPSEKSEEEKLRQENSRFKEAIGHLIVNWNEAVFGAFSREAAVAHMTHPKRQWAFVQVEQFVQRQEHFFKA